MKRKFSILLAGAFLFLFVGNNAMAQQKTRPEPKIGIQGTFAATSGIAIPVWVTKNLVVAPTFSFYKQNNSGTMIRPGVAIINHYKPGRIRPYYGGRFNITISSPDEGDGQSVIAVGGLFGADYYFHPLFCVGIQNQFNVTLENKDAGQPLTMSTATVITATIFIK